MFNTRAGLSVVLISAWTALTANAELFVATKPVEVLTKKEGGSLVVERIVGTGGLLFGPNISSIEQQLLYPVRVVDSEHCSGWVSDRAFDCLEEVVAQDIEGSRLSKMHEPESLPLSIRIQRSGKLKQAWVKATELVKKNETLPRESKVPEPLLARAAIWVEVHDYPKAVKDYLKALRYANASGASLSAYMLYLPKVRDAIANFENIPTASAGAGERDFVFRGAYFADGLHLFRIGDFRGAHDSFEDATYARPDKPAYWYYKALCNKKLGNERRALYDVLYGTLVERVGQEKGGGYQLRREVLKLLEKVQGADRQWIERFRRGDPTGRQIEISLAS